jgi:hypothetical protein
VHKRLHNTLIPSLFLLAALLSGCGLIPASGPVQPASEVVFSPPITQAVEPPATTEVVEVPPATEVVEPAPATPEPAPSEVLRVVYIKDNDLWIWTEGAGIKTLISTWDILEAFLSDDSLRIAFTRRVDDFSSEIWVINSDGTGERLLVSVGDVEAMVINRSPDFRGFPPPDRLDPRHA